jgi:hypothetical protein
VRGPAHELATLAHRLRERIDQGGLAPHMVRRQLRGLGLELLRRYPTDVELWKGFEALRTAGFQPPSGGVIPSGGEHEVLERVWAMSDAEVSACVVGLLELPDPAKDMGRSRAVIELLLRVGSEEKRVELLRNALAARESAHTIRRWQVLETLRSEEGLGIPDDAASWAPLQSMPLEGVEGARVLRSMAATHLKRLTSKSSDWLVPCCGSHMLMNWEATLRRRPATRSELRSVGDLLDQAKTLARSDSVGYTPLERTLLHAEEEDRKGNYDSATESLLGALSRFPSAPELRAVLIARAQLLLDGELAALLEADFGCASADITPHGGALRLNRGTEKVVPQDWCERIDRLGVEGSCVDDDDRFFLEQAGSIARATQSWLDVGSSCALIEASRIASQHSEDMKEPVIETLLAHVTADEFELKAHETQRELASWLATLLEEGSARRDWRVRLAAAGVTFSSETLTPPSDSDDPHSPVNRLSAGEDLLAEGHMDGASAIAASLMGKVDWSELLERFFRFLRDIFRSVDVPLALIEVVGRQIRQGPLAGGLLTLFGSDPRAAHPMLDVLYAIGKDSAVSEALRTKCLRAWIGVWRATDTVPADGLIRPFMRQDGGLLVLASALASGAADPVGVAARFLQAYPPLEHPPSTWGRCMLDMTSDES